MKTCEYIKRKSLLYITGVEYGDYTINHVLGCAHGCKYPCYAYMLKHRFGEISNYDEWIKPKLVSNALDLLEKEIPRLKTKISNVQLCFTTDPFMFGYDEIAQMSLQIISRLNSSGIPCSILTKGELPADLASFSKDNEYGITLVSLDNAFKKKMEPGAADIVNRINSLKVLSDKGCKTWVSIEPYPTPNIVSQNIEEILEAVSFTNKIIFGRTNYSRIVSTFPEVRKFYNDQASKVIAFCRQRHIALHIKQGTVTA